MFTRMARQALWTCLKVCRFFYKFAHMFPLNHQTRLTRDFQKVPSPSFTFTLSLVLPARRPLKR